jgi:hypothetical protein
MLDASTPMMVQYGRHGFAMHLYKRHARRLISGVAPFSEIDTPFRLGPMMPSTAPVPAEVLQISAPGWVGRGAPVDFPESVQGKHSQKMLCTSSEWHRACGPRVYIQTSNTVPPRSESKAASHRYVEGERHAER